MTTKSSTFGPAYEEKKDGPRVRAQHDRIRSFMRDHNWRTLGEISTSLEYPESSVSAQLRHLRKEQFGSYRIEKRRRNEEGLWEYRMLDPLPCGQLNLL